MASEGVENFQAIMVSAAAVAGSIIAGLGLWTWKQQIRWQQGRGLAVNTMQAFFAFKRIALDSRRQVYFPFREGIPETELLKLSVDAWSRATEYCAKLELAHTNFESKIAEAMVVWGDDFEGLSRIVSDVEHIARSTALTGAASIDVRATRVQTH